MSELPKVATDESPSAATLEGGAESKAPTSTSNVPESGNPTPQSTATDSGAVSEEDDEHEPEVLQYKIVILGDGSVGKSSIIHRLCTNNFAKQYKQTLGLDLFKKRVDLPGGVRASLHIWDIGGQTIGSKMLHNYIYAAQAIILVYDITNTQSFQNLEEWLKVVSDVFKKGELPYIAMVGNKMDLAHLRAVKPDKHTEFADNNNLFSFLISARIGDLVNLMFRRVAADLAGVVLTKAEIDVGSTVIPARIVNHPQHDPGQRQLVLKNNQSTVCAIQ